MEQLRDLSTEELRILCMDAYKETRKAHVLGCAETVTRLARIWAPESEEALLRGAYLHDITKRFSMDAQLIFCRKYGILLSNEDLSSPAVIHEITGAFVAERFFGESAAIVNAIRYHTTGRAGMSMEEILLFLADMIEPTRHYAELEEIRNAVAIHPYAGLEVALKRSLEFIKYKGEHVHSDTVKAYDWIRTIHL